MKRLLLVICLLLSFSAVVHGQTEDDVTSYCIPPDAQRRGPLVRKDPTIDVYSYLLPGVIITSENYDQNLIGMRTFTQGKLIKEELFRGQDSYKNPRKHGLEREWYPNGTLKSEVPYRDGVRDGIFKNWNEKGQLVGQNQLKDGIGIIRIYDSDGRLDRQEGYVHNLRDGLWFSVAPITPLYSFIWYKNGKIVDTAYDFYQNGALSVIGFFRPREHETVHLHGPFIQFSSRDWLPTKTWYVKGQEVTEAEYAKAAATDLTLPPYYADPFRYKEFVTPEVKKLFKEIRALKVKIPLQFDANGLPVGAN